MRVIVCSSSYPNPAEPNRGIVTGRRVRALGELAEVSVIAPVPYAPRFLPGEKYRRFARIPRQAVIDGLMVRYPRVLVTPKVGRSLYGLFYAAGVLRPMAHLVRQHRPDALLAFWAYPDGFAAVVLSKIFKLPVFVVGMGCDVNDLGQHPGKRRMVTWTFRHADGAFAVSRALGRRIVDLGVDSTRVKVVPNGLDGSYLMGTAAEPDAEPSPRSGTTVLYCGRLSPEKDPLFLMDAARLLLQNRPDARVTFVGDGPLRSQIEKRAAEWGIADRVTLAGEVRYDEIPELMRRADVLCLPSLREGYPNVLLEALACGLPVVATNVGGVPEIITHDSLGILIATRRPAELAQALDAALTRQWDRQVLRQSVRGRTWRDVATDIFGFIERTIR